MTLAISNVVSVIVVVVAVEIVADVVIFAADEPQPTQQCPSPGGWLV